MKKLSIVLLLVLFLSACSQAQPVPTTVTLTQTLTPTATVSSTPPYFPSYPPIFTNTFTPDWTRVAEARVTDAVFQATKDAKLSLASKFPVKIDDCYSVLFSADEQWMAGGCFDRFFIVNRDGSIFWKIDYKDLLASASPSATGVGVGPYHWSKDDRYIYFGISYEPSPDIIPDYFDFGMSPFSRPLYRLDTQSGTWNEITPRANTFSFSPTEKRLVLIQRDVAYCPSKNCPLNISVLDLTNGNLTKFVLPKVLAGGHVVWREDGLKFIFSTVEPTVGHTVYEMSDYKIFIFDVITKSLVELQTYKDSSARVSPISWSLDNILTIEIEKIYPESGITYQYLNIQTNTFISPPATATH